MEVGGLIGVPGDEGTGGRWFLGVCMTAREGQGGGEEQTDHVFHWDSSFVMVVSYR